MTEISKPDLNCSERIIYYFLKTLPSDYDNPQEVSKSEAEIARAILAKKYAEHVNLGVFWKLTFLIITYDLLFRLPAQVYGLLLSLLGSLALAIPNLYTPELLAEDLSDRIVENRSDIESKAVLSVKTNIGVAGLALGFILQLLTVIRAVPAEYFPQNLLKGVAPSWIIALCLFVLGPVILNKGISLLVERASFTHS